MSDDQKKKNNRILFAISVIVISLVLVLIYIIKPIPLLLAEEHLKTERLKRNDNEKIEIIENHLRSLHLPQGSDSLKLWKSFRQEHSYHIQTLALSKPNSNGNRTIIISEPPPDASLNDILYPFHKCLIAQMVKRYKVGHDGWVKDVVIAIKGDDAQISLILNELERLLFYTTYKAYISPLPAKVQPLKRYNLNLSVTASEISNWLLSKEESFSLIEGGKRLSLVRLISQRESGVYFSRVRGFVGWWIPRLTHIQECPVEAREFSLDTDLIVGAISFPEGVLIIGRERCVPVETLPPLRFETISLLASVESQELEQSYERTHLFAGRLDDKRDWAPIRLSPELVNTEYGSLLNITDQLLKGWSNDGQTLYDNFHYRKPDRWPFPTPLPLELNANELIYNWNTKGAGYTVNSGNKISFALSRTGSLPVSYKPSGLSRYAHLSVSDAEMRAYDYYSGLNDPNLVRVVQYAALYQIFQNFNLTSPRKIPMDYEPKKLLDRMTDDLTDKIASASSDQIARWSDRIASIQADYYNSDTSKRMNESVESNLHLLQEIFKRHKGSEIKNDSDLIRMIQVSTEKASKEAFDLRMVLSGLASLENLPENYASTLGKRKSRWIHTPSIVVSWNTDKRSRRNGAYIIESVGGHNLDAEVSRFELTKSVPPGLPIFDGNGVLRINPSDEGKISQVVYRVGHSSYDNASLSEIRKSLQNTYNKATRKPEAALDFPPPPPRSPRGLNSFVDPEDDFIGWEEDPNELSPSEEARFNAVAAVLPGIFYVNRLRDSSIRIIHSDGAVPFRADDIEDATDYVARFMNIKRAGKSAKIVFQGFNVEEAKGFIQSCEVRMTDKRGLREIIAIINKSDLDPTLLKEMTSNEYNFKDATVQVSKIRQAKDGTSTRTITLNINRSKSNLSTMYATIKLFFREGVDPKLIKYATNRAVKAVYDSLSKSKNILEFYGNAKDEFHKLKQELEEIIDIKMEFFRIKNKDIYVAELPGAVSNGASVKEKRS